LTDPDRLLAYRDAISNYRYTGYVEFRLSDQSYRWIARELDNISTYELARRMYEYAVVKCGVIDEVRETRPEYAERYEYHYDLRFTIQDVEVYLESCLRYRELLSKVVFF